MGTLKIFLCLKYKCVSVDFFSSTRRLGAAFKADMPSFVPECENITTDNLF